MIVPTIAPFPAVALTSRHRHRRAGLVAADYDDVVAKGGKRFGRRKADATSAW